MRAAQPPKTPKNNWCYSTPPLAERAQHNSSSIVHWCGRAVGGGRTAGARQRCGRSGSVDGASCISRGWECCVKLPPRMAPISSSIVHWCVGGLGAEGGQQAQGSGMARSGSIDGASRRLRPAQSAGGRPACACYGCQLERGVRGPRPDTKRERPAAEAGGQARQQRVGAPPPCCLLPWRVGFGGGPAGAADWGSGCCGHW